MTPYYEDDHCTIYHGDAITILGELDIDGPATMVTDPPYGIDYCTGSRRRDGNARSIANDTDTSARDRALVRWLRRPALVFGSWRVPKPFDTRLCLVWDKGGALGMGDLSMPWKCDHEEIYVLGRGYQGRRDEGSVLRFPPVQSVGRSHPHQKPVELMTSLIVKCPPGLIVDPFMGSGTTLRAAKDLGRKAIGIELEERYCEIAVKRLAQEVLPL